MSDNREATLLADWLSGEPGSPVPDGLDNDVMEAIYALRPEYAPNPRVKIEEILNTITDGPLLDPEIGRALQEWLNSPPGTPPPKKLPIGIVEATYALRPELAPALGFGIEDVLGDINQGPLAKTSVVNLDAERTRRQWWASPALGAAAVAATALFFVGPLADKADQPAPITSRSPVPEAEALSVEQVEIEVGFDATQRSLEEENIADVPAKPISRRPASAPTAQGVPPPPPPAAVVPEPQAMPQPVARMDEPATAPPSTRRSARSAAINNRDDGEMAEAFLGEGLTIEPQPTSSENVRSLRLNPQVATFDLQADQAITAGNFERALASIDAALTLPTLNRFETARLWRTKARVLTQLGRETDAQHARETAAKLDPTR